MLIFFSKDFIVQVEKKSAEYLATRGLACFGTLWGCCWISKWWM